MCMRVILRDFLISVPFLLIHYLKVVPQKAEFCSVWTSLLTNQQKSVFDFCLLLWCLFVTANTAGKTTSRSMTTKPYLIVNIVSISSRRVCLWEMSLRWSPFPTCLFWWVLSVSFFFPITPFNPFHSVFQGASVMMENMPYAFRLLLSTTFKTFNEGAFLTKPVGELMWGYDSKLVDFLNKYLPGMLPSSGKFGLFSEVSLR